jgi:hypothetical protein
MLFRLVLSVTVVRGLWAVQPCSVGDAVNCPNGGPRCAGDSCCPDGHACPSATTTFAGCPKRGKLADCTGLCYVGDAVSCPNGGPKCAGDSCCPDGHACPSASPGFAGCPKAGKIADCTAPPPPPAPNTTGTCQIGDAVKCANGGPVCAGDSCCPDGHACPSASSDFAGCPKAGKIEDCTSGKNVAQLAEVVHKASSMKPMALETCQVGDAVKCPNGGPVCAGDSCCPDGHACPSASSDFAGCPKSGKLASCIGSGPSPPAPPPNKTGTCQVGDAVKCANGGGICAGDSCCPDGHACPSASDGFAGCAKAGKVEDCTGAGPAPPAPPPSGTCQVGDAVNCPNGGPVCAGDSCCPDGHACPSASSDFTGCAKAGKLQDCTSGKSAAQLAAVVQKSSPMKTMALATCQVGDAVNCPNGGPVCAGDSCCPDGHACPSASSDFAGCPKSGKLESCIGSGPSPPAPPPNKTGTCQVGDAVKCANGGGICAGDSCCPDGHACPSASDDFAGCPKAGKVEDCTGAGPAPPAPPPSGTCQVGDAVNCPNGGPVCAGDSCCPDGHACPSASSDFTGCAKAGKLQDCTSGKSAAQLVAVVQQSSPMETMALASFAGALAGVFLVLAVSKWWSSRDIRQTPLLA